MFIRASTPKLPDITLLLIGVCFNFGIYTIADLWIAYFLAKLSFTFVCFCLVVNVLLDTTKNRTVRNKSYVGINNRQDSDAIPESDKINFVAYVRL